jgi:hypothetical protein
MGKRLIRQDHPFFREGYSHARLLALVAHCEVQGGRMLWPYLKGRLGRTDGPEIGVGINYTSPHFEKLAEIDCPLKKSCADCVDH